MLKKVNTTSKLIKANGGYFLSIPKHMMDFMDIKLHELLHIVYNDETKELTISK